MLAVSTTELYCNIFQVLNGCFVIWVSNMESAHWPIGFHQHQLQRQQSLATSMNVLEISDNVSTFEESFLRPVWCPFSTFPPSCLLNNLFILLSKEKKPRKHKSVQYLKVPISTSKCLEVPQSTQKYLKVPRSTSKYLEVHHRPGQVCLKHPS